MKYKCISLIGSRQAGKTNLSKEVFSDFQYLTFNHKMTLIFLFKHERLFKKT